MWFIITIIYMNYGNIEPEILVYKSIFKSKESCQRVYQDNPKPFINELSNLKPQAKSMSITCVDAKTLNDLKLQNKIKKL
jgi:hypothetical protein